MARQINTYVSTGAAAIAYSTPAITAGKRKVISVMIHFNSAPTTSGNLTIKYDPAGALYDTQLLAVNPGSSSLTDIVWSPDGELLLVPGEVLTITYANADTKTYGITIKMEEV